MKTLVIFAHPNMETASIANKIIFNELVKSEDIEVRQLYALYPDFKIDVEAEQSALVSADLIIFQYPFHWYSMPGLLKEWLDKVFLYGFAYGREGNQLKGKALLISTTIGGPESSYQQDGHNSFTVEEFLKPLQQTARFTGLCFNQPIVSHEMVYVPDVHNRVEIEARAHLHAQRLLAFIDSKRDSLAA